MALKRDRAFALFGAILFFATSLGLSFAVIWQMYQSNHKGNTTNNSSTNQEGNKTVNGNQLQGTALKDFTPVADVPSLQTTDTTAGTGAEVKSGDTVTVDYTGAVAATGTIFQSSLDSGQPVTFGLSQVIEGWQQGIPGMKVGGTRRLLIPANLAYGANPPSGSGIPANAALVFDVTLKSIGGSSN